MRSMLFLVGICHAYETTTTTYGNNANYSSGYATLPYDSVFWEIESGSEFCEIVDGGHCVTDGHGLYGNYEQCTVKALRPLTLWTHHYHIESGYDYISVSGMGNFSDYAPQGVQMDTGMEVRWRSDGSVTNHGFKMCADIEGPDESDVSFGGADTTTGSYGSGSGWISGYGSGSGWNAGSPGSGYGSGYGSGSGSYGSGSGHGGCPVPHWKGDTICDADNNKEECDYDGGDCCDEAGHDVTDTSSCPECKCKDPRKASGDGGLRLKSNKAGIELGPHGDIKLGRVGPGHMRLDSEIIHITGALAAKKLFIEGMPLDDYIDSLVMKAMQG